MSKKSKIGNTSVAYEGEVLDQSDRWTLTSIGNTLYIAMSHAFSGLRVCTLTINSNDGEGGHRQSNPV